MKHFKLLEDDTISVAGHILYRIEATRDFVLSYKMGDKGTPDYNGNGYVVEYDRAGQKL